MKDFLSTAAATWRIAPRLVLLLGDASLDPRNYLGRGDLDLVPTKLVDTGYMETASDDWFAVQSSDGVPREAIGRLPARADFEAGSMISKIIGYERSSPARQSVLLVGDADDSYHFGQLNSELRSLIPPDVNITEIQRTAGDTSAHTALIEQIANGQSIVNYVGHGSIDKWR